MRKRSRLQEGLEAALYPPGFAALAAAFSAAISSRVRRSTGPSSCATADAGERWALAAPGSSSAGSAVCSAALLACPGAAFGAAATAVGWFPWPAGGLSYSALRLMTLSNTWCGVGPSVGLRPSPPACGGVPASLPWWAGDSAAAAAGVDAGLGPALELYFLASSRMDSGTEVEDRRFQEGERAASAQQRAASGNRGAGQQAGWDLSAKIQQARGKCASRMSKVRFQVSPSSTAVLATPHKTRGEHL